MIPPVDAPATPPPPPAPRPVPLGAARWVDRFLMLFGGIWALTGTMLSVVFTLAGGPVWNDWILDSRGQRADATPFEEHATHSSTNGRTVHEIQFHFTDGTGQARTGRTGTTSRGLIESARKRAPFTVEYDPEAPDRVRLAGGSASFFGMIVLFPLGLALMGWGLALRGLWSTRRVRALYRDGIAATAQVVAIEGTSMRQNRQPVVRMVYELRGPTGMVQGTWNTTVPKAKGASLWVIHDPEQPARSVPADV